MPWSFKIARIAGIDVRIHATFFLLLAFMGSAYAREGGASAAIAGVLFTCLVFGCVLLHEFGHALAARRYGIRTPDITLLPIGGIARLDRMPDRPIQEVIVAIAGPLVNVAIATVLWFFLALTSGVPALETLRSFDNNMLLRLLIVNVGLVLFNLIPAFPMDGGRILRAFLAMRMDYARATHIAAMIGQAAAFVCGLAALLHHPPVWQIVLVAVFIYFGAASEASLAEMKSVSSGMRVQSAMVTHFRALTLEATLDQAVETLLSTSQHEFPVVDVDGKVHGLLTRDDLILALRKSGPDGLARDAMRVNVPCVHPTMPFDRAFAIMQDADCPALPVLDTTGRLVGLFTPENVGELMMVHSALAKSRKASRTPGGPLPPPLPVR
jgi:Zn-dependent protease/CBS domain-containing protein